MVVTCTTTSAGKPAFIVEEIQERFPCTKETCHRTGGWKGCMRCCRLKTRGRFTSTAKTTFRPPTSPMTKVSAPTYHLPTRHMEMSRKYEAYISHTTSQGPVLNGVESRCTSILKSQGCSAAQLLSVSLPVVIGAIIVVFLGIAAILKLKKCFIRKWVGKKKVKSSIPQKCQKVPNNTKMQSSLTDSTSTQTSKTTTDKGTQSCGCEEELKGVGRSWFCNMYVGREQHVNLQPKHCCQNV